MSYCLARDGTKKRALLPRGTVIATVIAVVLLLLACSRPPLYRSPPGGSQELFRASQTNGLEDGEERRPPEPSVNGPSIAVITLEDARPARDKEALSSWLAEHGGYTGEAVTRDMAYRRPLTELASDALARALADTGKFSEVKRVSRPRRAGDYDLVLTGRLRRLRGWQAYRVESDRSSRVIESMGDVFLDEMHISDSRTGKLVFIGQTGAMLEEIPETVDPYAVARTAFVEALGALAEQVEKSDLNQTVSVEVRMRDESRGGLDDLLESLPEGWSGRRMDLEVPAGWSGEPRCRKFHFADDTRVNYHPRLGFFSPEIEMWSCRADWAGEMDLGGEGVRYHATVIGSSPDGGAVLILSLGKSSWPDAIEDLARYLDLAPPEGEPVFSLPMSEAEPVDCPSRVKAPSEPTPTLP